MDKMLEFLESRLKPRNLHALNLADRFYLLVSRELGFTGFNLGQQFLILDSKNYRSFRVYVENLRDWRGKINLFESKELPDLLYLEQYFSDNRDNPYGVQLVFRSLLREERLGDLTQFPPLEPWVEPGEKERRLRRLVQLALPADAVFSFDSTSTISHLIREYDKSPWSHCAVVASDKTIVDVTTAGVVRSSFSTFNHPAISVGLYRYKGATDQEKALVAAEAESRIGVKGYNWYMIFRLLLRNRFNLPYSGAPSVADIIYSNKLELIAYA